MSKRRAPTTALSFSTVQAKAAQLCDARIDAAVVEYAEIMTNWESVDFNDLDRRVSEAKQGGFPPEPLWRRQQSGEPRWRKRQLSTEPPTVATVPEARGGFKW